MRALLANEQGHEGDIKYSFFFGILLCDQQRNGKCVMRALLANEQDHEDDTRHSFFLGSLLCNQQRNGKCVMRALLASAVLSARHPPLVLKVLCSQTVPSTLQVLF